MAEFLQFSGQTFLVMGVANRKSVAWLTARTLEEQGARVIYSVRSPARKQSLESLLAGKPVFVCDVEDEGAPARLAEELKAAGFSRIDGVRSEEHTSELQSH